MQTLKRVLIKTNRKREIKDLVPESGKELGDTYCSKGNIENSTRFPRPCMTGVTWTMWKELNLLEFCASLKELDWESGEEKKLDSYQNHVAYRKWELFWCIEEGEGTLHFMRCRRMSLGYIQEWQLFLNE